MKNQKQTTPCVEEDVKEKKGERLRETRKKEK
jgi:hypothetical protein